LIYHCEGLCCRAIQALRDKCCRGQINEANLDISFPGLVPVEHEEEAKSEQNAVFPYLLDGVMVEEYVSVDLWIA